jgi:hypothetical protein
MSCLSNFNKNNTKKKRTWFQLCLAHQLLMSKELLELPQGQLPQAEHWPQKAVSDITGIL